MVLILAQVGIAAYAIGSDDTTGEPDAPIFPTTEITEPLNLEAASALGLAVAREWRPDAILVNAGMQVDWSDESADQLATELPRGGWALLRYLSGRDVLTLRIDRGSGVVVETEVLRLSEDDAANLALQAIDYERASTNSTTAILATEAAYGQHHRLACPERRRATWISVHSDEFSGERVWFVRYRDAARPNEITLSVLIDWRNGSIYDLVNPNSNCLDEEA